MSAMKDMDFDDYVFIKRETWWKRAPENGESCKRDSRDVIDRLEKQLAQSRKNSHTAKLKNGAIETTIAQQQKIIDDYKQSLQQILRENKALRAKCLQTEIKFKKKHVSLLKHEEAIYLRELCKESNDKPTDETYV
eukprot:UN32778